MQSNGTGFPQRDPSSVCKACAGVWERGCCGPHIVGDRTGTRTSSHLHWSDDAFCCNIARGCASGPHIVMLNVSPKTLESMVETGTWDCGPHI